MLTESAKAGRLLVTHDRKTMPAEFGEFVLDRESAGVIVVPQTLPVRRAAEDLVLIWTATEADEWINRIYSLPISGA